MSSGYILFKVLVPLLLALYLFFLISTASDSYQGERFSLSSGREIYDSNCAGCHGEKGDGSAFRGAFNFTNNEFMITENSSIFFDAVTSGVPGTAMPSFGGLSTLQRWEVTAYLWTFWMDSAGVENGITVYQKNCASCHGINGNGSGTMGAFDFTNVSRMVGEDPESFFNGVSNGVVGTSMASWKDHLSVDERWNAVKYIWTFQFIDYFQINQASSETPEIERTSTGEMWYFLPSGLAVISISILLAFVVVYLFGKGMIER